jgi:hypothetical protein
MLMMSANFNEIVCTPTSTGPCTIYNCPFPNPLPGDSAGTLTISGGSIPAGTTMLPIPAQSNSYGSSLSGSFVAGGDTVTVSATGATVPAFGPHSVTAPGSIDVTSPAVTGASPIVISTSSDLTVTWTGGQSGATVSLSAATETITVGPVIDCEWDAAAGQGVVPQSLLGQIGTGQGSMSLVQRVTTTFSAGPYLVSLHADVRKVAQTSAVVTFQ